MTTLGRFGVTGLTLALAMSWAACTGQPAGDTGDSGGSTDTSVDDSGVDCPDPLPFFEDSDGDGFGNAEVTEQACEAPEGFVDDDRDCDDEDAAVNPDATEVCNEVDDDCDGLVDTDDDSLDTDVLAYPDGDGDGWGVEGDDGLPACEAPDGFVVKTGDCDDTVAAIHPGATEICDTLDNDCDGLVDDEDDSRFGGETWYVDDDGDGLGSDATTRKACLAPEGFVDNAEDCDDGSTAVGGPSEWWPDDDGDGFGDEDSAPDLECEAPADTVDNGDDCDDDDEDINPDRFDWGDGVDNDCDTALDEDVGSEAYDYSDVDAIMKSYNCTGCHSSTIGRGYSGTVNQPSGVRGLDYFEPGSPAGSYIWHKIDGTHRSVGGSGNTMPPSGSVSSTDLGIVRQWLEEGAVE